MLAFTILMILVIVTTLNTLKNDYQDFVLKEEIRQVCYTVRNSIETVYQPIRFNISLNATLGTMTLRLPEKIGDVNYRAGFNNRSVFIRTLEEPLTNTTCKIGYEAIYNGSSSGLTEIQYRRDTNQTNIITLIKK